MRIPLGPGPVFVFEWMQTSRRWQTFAARALFLAGLLASLLVVWATRVPNQPQSLNTLAKVGEVIFYALVGTQVALVLLAAPAYTAGAICLDKGRGNLTHLLTTDLSAVEIAMGKLLARLLPVLSLVCASLPVLALAILLGGIHPEAVFGAFLVSLVTAIFGCSLALTLSVWGKKGYEGLLATYLVLTLLLLCYPAQKVLPAAWGVGGSLEWTIILNPFYLAFSPYLTPGRLTWEDYAWFAAGGLGLSLLLCFVSIARLRAVVLRQEGRPERRRWSPSLLRDLLSRIGPSLDRNPVFWHEWHRRRPSFWVRVVWAIYLLLALGAAAIALYTTVVSGGRGELCAFVNAFVFSIGLLLVAVSSVTSLQEERTRGSLDILMTTPLPTATILWGKWMGSYRMVPPLTLIPFVLVLVAGVAGELGGKTWHPMALLIMLWLMLAMGAAVTALGLALATWIKRFGRAVAVSVVVYILITASLVLLLLALPGNDNEAIAMGSPWFGVGQLTFSAGSASGHRLELSLIGGVAWSLVYLLAAGVLLAATFATFDACLGRMSNLTGRPRLRPGGSRRSRDELVRSDLDSGDLPLRGPNHANSVRTLPDRPAPRSSGLDAD